MIDQIWANSIVEHCLRSGLDHFFLAPGSRCTPLTLAVAKRNDVQVTQHFDERGLAFAALGYARATGKPGVFICTSGTAVANAYPAVIEAATEHVPMLLFTADRPTELRGSGANQTINQLNIFGSYPTLFLDLPAPEDQTSDEDPNGVNFLSGVLQEGIAASSNGPVHLNWMFREPFTVASVKEECHSSVLCPETVWSDSTTADEEAAGLPIEINGNVLIALGRCHPQEAAEAVKLSLRLNCPMLSDVTSGLRSGSFELPNEFKLPTPDAVLHLGGRIVSKKWHQWTASLAGQGIDFVHLTPTGETINPNRLPVRQFQTSLSSSDSKVTATQSDEAFTDRWQKAIELRNEVVQRHLENTESLTEPAVAFAINRRCPVGNGLFIGNSTPIRDMDWYGCCDSNVPRFVAANRGASGIDGLLASATGYASGLEKPTTVVLGDLSALHDLNSLALVAKSKQPMIVVIINNQAGHIFDLLPVRRSEHFEQFFATPHPYQFENAAKMFGLEYERITTMAGFKESYDHALSREQGIVMLELMTDRNHNQEVRQLIRDEVAKCSQP